MGRRILAALLILSLTGSLCPPSVFALRGEALPETPAGLEELSGALSLQITEDRPRTWQRLFAAGFDRDRLDLAWSGRETSERGIKTLRRLLAMQPKTLDKKIQGVEALGQRLTPTRILHLSRAVADREIQAARIRAHDELAAFRRRAVVEPAAVSGAPMRTVSPALGSRIVTAARRWALAGAVAVSLGVAAVIPSSSEAAIWGSRQEQGQTIRTATTTRGSQLWTIAQGAYDDATLTAAEAARFWPVVYAANAERLRAYGIESAEDLRRLPQGVTLDIPPLTSDDKMFLRAHGVTRDTVAFVLEQVAQRQVRVPAPLMPVPLSTVAVQPADAQPPHVPPMPQAAWPLLGLAVALGVSAGSLFAVARAKELEEAVQPEGPPSEEPAAAEEPAPPAPDVEGPAAGLEELTGARAVAQAHRTIQRELEQLLGLSLVKGQRRGRGYLAQARELANAAVEGLRAAAVVAGVDVADPQAVEGFLRPLVSSRAYLVATGHGIRFSPMRLIPKQLYPADGVIPNMRRAMEPLAFTTEPPVAIIDGVVGYHLLAQKFLTRRDRERILDSLEQRWPRILAAADVAAEALPWEDVRPLVERQLVYVRHPEQRRDLAAAARVFGSLLSLRLGGADAEGKREVLFEGFLRALFQPIIEWTPSPDQPDQENPYLDPARVERLVGRQAILALGPATGPGGALEAGYRRVRTVGLPPVAWDLPVYSDRAEDAFPFFPNVYLVAFLKALASYRDGVDHAALLVVSGKLPDARGPYGRGQVLLDAGTGIPLVTEWRQLTVEQRTLVKAQWELWSQMPEEERTAVLHDSPSRAPWVNLGAFVVSHPFGRRALAAMVRQPRRWGHLDPKKAFRPEFWYTDWPAYRLHELTLEAGAPPRVEAVFIPEDAPEGSKEAARVMAFRQVARRRHLIPPLPGRRPEERPPGLAGAELIPVDQEAIRNLMSAEDRFASILAVLDPAAQPIRRYLAPGEFLGDLQMLTGRAESREAWSPAPVATPGPRTGLVRHPDRYVPGAARLDQLDLGNRAALLGYIQSELHDIIADVMPRGPARQALLTEVKVFLAAPATGALTAEQVYQWFFQRLRAWASQEGIADPWTAAKRRYEEPVLAFAVQRLRRVQAARTPAALGRLFQDLAVLATQANLLDGQSESARHIFTRPGFFDDFARNLQAAVAAHLAINGLARYRQLAMGERGTVLYVTDNFEEAYLDFAVAALLVKLGHTVVMAGKAQPARGDATLDDLQRIRARLMAQDPRLGRLLNQIRLISSGTDTYGTLLHQATPEFAEALQTARFIVLKGQANLYTTVTMNALNTRAPIVLSLLSKGYTAQWVTGVPKPRGILVDEAEISVINRTGGPLDVEEVLDQVFTGSDQIEIQGRLSVEPTVRIADGTAFRGTVVLTGETVVGPGRLLEDVVAHDTFFEGHPRLDAFSYEPPAWRPYGYVEGQEIRQAIVRWDGTVEPRAVAAGLEEPWDVTWTFLPVEQAPSLHMRKIQELLQDLAIRTAILDGVLVNPGHVAEVQVVHHEQAYSDDDDDPYWYLWKVTFVLQDRSEVAVAFKVFWPDDLAATRAPRVLGQTVQAYERLNAHAPGVVPRLLAYGQRGALVFHAVEFVPVEIGLSDGALLAARAIQFWRASADQVEDRFLPQWLEWGDVHFFRTPAGDVDLRVVSLDNLRQVSTTAQVIQHLAHSSLIAPSEIAEGAVQALGREGGRAFLQQALEALSPQDPLHVPLLQSLSTGLEEPKGVAQPRASAMAAAVRLVFDVAAPGRPGPGHRADRPDSTLPPAGPTDGTGLEEAIEAGQTLGGFYLRSAQKGEELSGRALTDADASGQSPSRSVPADTIRSRSNLSAETYPSGSLLSSVAYLERLVEQVRGTLPEYGWAAALGDPASTLTATTGGQVVLDGARGASFDCATGALALKAALVQAGYPNVQIAVGAATDGIYEVFALVNGHRVTVVPGRQMVDDPALTVERVLTPRQERELAAFRARAARLGGRNDTKIYPMSVITSEEGTQQWLLFAGISLETERVILRLQARDLEGSPLGRTRQLEVAVARSSWADLQRLARTSTEAELTAHLKALAADGDLPAETWPAVQAILAALVRKLDLTPRAFVVPAAPWADAGAAETSWTQPVHPTHSLPGAPAPAHSPAVGRLGLQQEGLQATPAQFPHAFTGFTEWVLWLPWMTGPPGGSGPPGSPV